MQNSVPGFICAIPSYMHQFNLEKHVEPQCHWEIEFVESRIPTDSQVETLVAYDDGKPIYLDATERSSVVLGGYSSSRKKQIIDKEVLIGKVGLAFIIKAYCSTCDKQVEVRLRQDKKGSRQSQGSRLLCCEVTSDGKKCGNFCS